MHRVCIALAIALIACSKTTIKPRSCGATCNSNIECSTGVLPTCKFCNFGSCSAVRPELPMPLDVDAGVDVAADADPGAR